jgi:hypothetical protein
MFKLAAEGYTLRQIGDTLLKRGFKSFQAGRVWQTPSVSRIIRSRAAVGELILKQAGARDVVTPGYYPAAVSEEQWSAANAMFAGIKRVSGRAWEGNFFRGLVFDGNGNPAHVDRQFRHGKWYAHYRIFIRETAKQASSGWKPDKLQRLIVATLEEAHKMPVRVTRDKRDKRGDVETRIAKVEAELGNLSNALANGYSRTLEAALRDREAELDALKVKLVQLKAQDGALPVKFKAVANHDSAALMARIRAVIARVVLLDRETVRVELRAGWHYVIHNKPEGVTLDIPESGTAARA